MTPQRLLFLAGAAFLLFLCGLGAGIYWYFFSAPEIDSAQLLPANTLAFASIPNGVTLAAGYQTSRLKTLVESPNAKPLQDALVAWIGQKNADLIRDFLPNLSGQSFIAVTHFDYGHPEQIGLIAAMRPKAGLANFDQFVEKLTAAWPNLLQQGHIGSGDVAGVHYDWIQGPGATDKICVAHVGGWIVTAWGEASLQDWIERFHNQSQTTSLKEDPNYQKAVQRLGDNPTTLVYLNSRSLLTIAQQQLAKTNPDASDYLAHTLVTPDGAALATRFDGGEIVDHFSFLIPQPAQQESGLDIAPCPFETMKFTDADTRFYWAGGIDWQQCYKMLKGPASATPDHPNFNPMGDSLTNFLINWAHNAGLSIQENIVDPLGSEVSLQSEWSQDSTYPDVGLFVKINKPDNFKPTITAIVDTLRKTYANSAVVKELNSNGQNFAVLQFVQNSQFTPTITEDGPYFGVFLSVNQAVRSFQRDGTASLLHNTEFTRQTAGKLPNATQLFFLDAPRLLDRGYQTAMPYLSLAGMFDKNTAALLKGRQLPPDLDWLAPMGTWSCVITPQVEGLEGYSVSGVGNQGILLGAAAAGTMNFMQTMGWLPKPPTPSATPYVTGAPPATAASAPPDAAGATSTAADLAKLPLSTDAPVDNTPTPAGSIIYLTATGRVYFDATPVTIDQIDDFLKNKKLASPALKLAVKVDKFASADTLSRVMAAATSAGFGVLPFTYTTVSDPPPIGPATNSAPVANSDSTVNSASASPNSTPSTNSLPPANAPAPASP